MNHAQSQSGPSEGFAQLNVVFHGLWAFETTNAGPIIAYTPILTHDIGTHEFVAGSVLSNVKLAEGERHYLSGVDDMPHKDFDFTEEDNVIVCNKPFTDDGKAFCSVELHPPAVIKSVRLVPVTSTQPFEGEDGKDLHPVRVAMVQVFIYYVKDPEKVSLEPIQVNPTHKEGAWNLHLYAQPTNRLPEDHAKNAYKAMAAMFGLNIIPIEPLFAPISDPHIMGLKANDMLGLDELGHGSGSNCDGLIVSNRSPRNEYSDSSASHSSDSV